MEQLEGRIKTILCEMLHVTPSDIDDDTELRDDLGADDLDIAEIILDLEEEFDLDIDATDEERLVTFKDLVEFIQKSI